MLLIDFCLSSPYFDRNGCVPLYRAVGTVLRLGSTEPAKAETSVEELAKLEHEELIKLAPEVQGEDRLRAWREEKEVEGKGRIASE